MSLSKREKAALKELRRYIVLGRASLTPPSRAVERGYQGRLSEPHHRPLAGPIAEDLVRWGSNEWTNDVAESLKVYTESWILPIIDALLADDERSLSYLAQITGIQPTLAEYRKRWRKEKKSGAH